MSDELYKLLDELGLNLTIKRHSPDGKFNARVYHRWITNPILSCKKDDLMDCITELSGRTHAIENMRTFITAKNKKREEMLKTQAGRAKWDTEENECIWSDWS